MVEQVGRAVPGVCAPGLPAAPTPASAGREIVADGVQCILCGYGLTGMGLEARCSECREPVQTTLRLGKHIDAWERRVLVGGMLLPLAAMATLALGFGFGNWIGWTEQLSEDWFGIGRYTGRNVYPLALMVSSLVLPVVTMVLWFAALVNLSLPSPHPVCGSGRFQRIDARRWLGWPSIIGMTTLILGLTLHHALDLRFNLTDRRTADLQAWSGASAIFLGVMMLAGVRMGQIMDGRDRGVSDLACTGIAVFALAAILMAVPTLLAGLWWPVQVDRLLVLQVILAAITTGLAPVSQLAFVAGMAGDRRQRGLSAVPWGQQAAEPPKA